MKPNPVPFALFSFVCLSFVPVTSAQTPRRQPHLPTDRQMSSITAQVPAPPEALKITFGDKSASWTPAQLTAMPQTTMTAYSERTKANVTYTGVPLMDLMTKVGVPAKPHGKDFRLYLVAAGSDGYEVVFSMGELTPYLHQVPVIVADTENGKALTSDGPLKLVATQDKQPERWVRNLVLVRVLPAE